MTFGERLNRLCKHKGISRQQLAQWLNVSDRTALRIITNDALIDIEQLQMLSDKLNVNVEYLLGLSDLYGTDKWYKREFIKLIDRWSKSADINERIGSIHVQCALDEVEKINKGEK